MASTIRVKVFYVDSFFVSPYLMFFHEQILMNVYSLWTTVTMTQQHAITLLEASTVPAYLITLQSLDVRTSVIVSVDYNICHIY